MPGATGGVVRHRPEPLPPPAAGDRRRDRVDRARRRRGSAGLRPGYELKLNSYDLGVDIELARRGAAAAVRASRRCGAVVITGGLEQGVLRRRQHPDARASRPHCVEGELLQVHERDAHAHRGRDRRTPARPTWRRSTAPPPAAATSWRSRATDHAGRRPARRRSRCRRCRCSACCPGTGGLTRLVDKRRRAPGPRRRGSPPAAEGSAAKTAQAWRLVDEVAPPSRCRRAPCAERAGVLAARSHASAGAGRHRAHPAGPGSVSRRPRSATRHVTADLDRAAGLVDDHRARARGRAAGRRGRACAHWARRSGRWR